MNRRQLFVAGGALLVIVVALRRRRRHRRERVDIEIEDPAQRDEPGSDEGDADELDTLEGIGPAYADRLRDAGVDDLSALVAADPTDLARESGIAEGRIRTWIDRASERPDG